MYTCIHVYVYTYIHIYTHIYKYTYIHVYAYTYIHINIYTYIEACIYIGISIYATSLPYYYGDSWACPAFQKKEGMPLVCLEKDFKDAKERLEKSLRENKFKTPRDKEKSLSQSFTSVT